MVLCLAVCGLTVMPQTGSLPQLIMRGRWRRVAGAAGLLWIHACVIMMDVCAVVFFFLHRCTPA